MLLETDDLSWYARKAARVLVPSGPLPEGLSRRLDDLLARLREAGVRGDAESMTFLTGALPEGCRSCLKGRGTNLFVTGWCTRDCFFCFNHKPRRDELVVHGIPVESPEAAAEVVERFGLRSVGLSGGEPLLRPKRLLAVIKALKALPRPPRLDLYTNADLLLPGMLRRLKDAGLDSIRINAVARGYDLSPLPRALEVFPDLAVEIPAVPKELGRQKKLILELELLGVRHLNLHELFVCPENSERMAKEGYAAAEAGHEHLLWKPVPESAVAALELLLFAKRNASRLSVYYCSCGTQDLISKRGLARRAAR